MLHGEHLDVLSANSNHLEFSSGVQWMSNDVAEDRVRKGVTVSRRIRWAPLPVQTQASLTACSVGPAAMFSLHDCLRRKHLVGPAKCSLPESEAGGRNVSGTAMRKVKGLWCHFALPLQPESDAPRRRPRPG